MRSREFRDVPYAKPGTPEREELTAKAAQQIEQARINLMLNAPFFGMLVAYLRTELIWPEQWPRGVPATAFTDGRRICFNPMFALSIEHGCLCTVLCHEVLHAALDHISRLVGRIPLLWNFAADFVVNEVLQDFLLTTNTRAREWKMLPGVLLDARYRGMSAEQVYESLRKKADEQTRRLTEILLAADAQGNGSPGGGASTLEEVLKQIARGYTIFVRPASFANGTGSDGAEQSESSLASREIWTERLIRASQVAGQHGTLPESMQQVINGLLAPVVDWRVVLQAFVEQTARADYTFRQPNRNLLYMNLYLPSLSSPALREVVVIVDDSGSCQDSIRQFLSECVAIFDLYPGCLLHLVSCDVKPVHVLDWEPGDTEPSIDTKFSLYGGGGTSFVRPFEMIRDKGWEPSVVIYLTDLYGTMPPGDLDPGCPVLWVVNRPPGPGDRVPFGTMCHFNKLGQERPAG
jgi:predicted metal-dependent peptidase